MSAGKGNWITIVLAGVPGFERIITLSELGVEDDASEEEIQKAVEEHLGVDWERTDGES